MTNEDFLTSRRSASDPLDARKFNYYLKGENGKKEYKDLTWTSLNEKEECAVFNNSEGKNPGTQREMQICRKKGAQCNDFVKECFTNIQPVPLSYEAKKAGSCGPFQRGCPTGSDDFVEGEFAKSQKKPLQDASARDVCEFLKEKEKGFFDAFNPLDTFKAATAFLGADNETVKKNLSKVGVNVDTTMKVDSSQSCENLSIIRQNIGYSNTCAAEAFVEKNRLRYAALGKCANDLAKAGIQGAAGECKSLFSKDPETEKAELELLKASRTDITSDNKGEVIQKCNATKDIITKNASKPTLTNALLQQAKQSATSLLASNKSSQQNCNILNQNMSACQYLQEKQCCLNKVDLDQNITVNCGFALTEKNVKSTNYYNANQTCTLRSTSNLDNKQTSEIVNAIIQADEQEADAGLAALLWAFIMPLIIMIVGAVVVFAAVGVFVYKAGKSGMQGAMQQTNSFFNVFMYYVPAIFFLTLLVLFVLFHSEIGLSFSFFDTNGRVIENRPFYGRRKFASSTPSNCTVPDTTLDNMRRMLDIEKAKEDASFCAFDFIVTDGSTKETFESNRSKGVAILFLSDVTLNAVDPPFQKVEGSRPGELWNNKQNDIKSSFYKSQHLIYSASFKQTATQTVPLQPVEAAALSTGLIEANTNREKILFITYGIAIGLGALTIGAFFWGQWRRSKAKSQFLTEPNQNLPLQGALPLAELVQGVPVGQPVVQGVPVEQPVVQGVPVGHAAWQ